MRLSIAALLTFVTFITSATAATCASKHASVAKAIQQFCSNNKLVAPSTYSINGVKGPVGDSRVSIIGLCLPPQWVPTAYCTAQFTKMCENDQTVAHYGRRNCQSWIIKYATNPINVITYADYYGQGRKTTTLPPTLLYDTGATPSKNF